MRRLVPVLAALTAALSCALLSPEAAGAAEGRVRVNGNDFRNPQGCFYVSQTVGLLEIENHTDRVATAYLDPYCSGDRVVGQVAPGEVMTYPAKSISLP